MSQARSTILKSKQATLRRVRVIRLAGALITMCISSLCLAPPALADDQQRIYRSAHFLGRGDTGIALADGEDAIFYNPAGIAQGKGIYKTTVLASPMLEVSNDTRTLATQLLAQDGEMIATLRKYVGKPQHAGFYNFSGIVLRRAALGLIASGTTDILVSKSAETGGLEQISAEMANTAGATFTLADSFWDETLLIGATGKYLYRGEAAIELSVLDQENFQNLDTNDLLGFGTGFGVDLGIMLKGKGHSEPAMGVTVHNVGTTRMSSELAAESSALKDLKQSINVGFALQPGTKFSKFRLLADYHDVTNVYGSNVLKKIHLGGEISVTGMIGVTGGLNQGAPGAGIWFNAWLLRVDLGMYTEETGDRVGTRPDRRLYARIRAGF